MELWLLNNDFTKLEVIEGYVSFIWTERYDEYGDFKLRVPIKQIRTHAFRVGRYIWNTESNKLMRILSYIKDTFTEDGEGDTVTLEGKSMEYIFQERVLLPNRETGGLWIDENYAGNLATTMVSTVCVTGENQSSLDVIPNLDLAWPGQVGRHELIEVRPTSLYEAFVPLIQASDLGFRVNFNRATKRFTFHVFEGVEKSLMRFMPENDNIINVRHMNSIVENRNVAYVHHREFPTPTVVSWNDETYSGLDRRVMVVDGSSIQAPTVTQLRREGRIALRNHRNLKMMDGEAIGNSFVYNQTYRMGDIVQVRDELGRESRARIVEYIWSHDSKGFKSYPTFRIF